MAGEVSNGRKERKLKPIDLLSRTPDMTIGLGVSVKGGMKFEGFLRIEGSVEGQIVAPKDSVVMMADSGSYHGDLLGFSVVYIDGKVIGDIYVEHLALGSHAVIHGDVKCRSIEIEANAILVGELQVATNVQIEPAYTSNNDDLSDEQDEVRDIEPESKEDVVKKECKVFMLLFEPQVDFYPGGSWGSYEGLGARDSAERLAEFTTSHLDSIDQIYVALDTHQKIQTCSSKFWVNPSGSCPDVNTRITLDDVHAQHWLPRRQKMMDYCVESLSNSGNEVIIEQEHCLIGTAGTAILPIVNSAINEWEDHRMKNIGILNKVQSGPAALSSTVGSLSSMATASPIEEVEVGTEVESVGQESCEEAHGAEVSGPKTEPVPYSLDFAHGLGEDDKLLLAGQASCHCRESGRPRFSLRSLVPLVLKQNPSLQPQNIIFVKDALFLDSQCLLDAADGSNTASLADPNAGTFSVAQLIEEFWEDLVQQGVTITTTTEITDSTLSAS